MTHSYQRCWHYSCYGSYAHKGKAYFVYSYVQRRLMGQYNGKRPISLIYMLKPLVTAIRANLHIPMPSIYLIDLRCSANSMKKHKFLNFKISLNAVRCDNYIRSSYFGLGSAVPAPHVPGTQLPYAICNKGVNWKIYPSILTLRLKFFLSGKSSSVWDLALSSMFFFYNQHHLYILT